MALCQNGTALLTLPRRSAIFLTAWAMLPGTTDAQARTAPAHTQTRKVTRPVLRVLTFDGAIKAAQEKALFEPYAKKENLNIVASAWNGSLEELAGQENKTPDRWSAVMMETSSLRLGCSLNLLVRDPADNSSNSCGEPITSIDFAMAWEMSYFDSAPDWTDFWDVARHPGQRSLRRDPRTTLEIALLADGVPPGGLYAVLSSRAGLERAFRKLDQIRPYIVWWNTPAEATDIMKTNGALMGIVPVASMLSLPQQERQHFGIFWPQRLSVTYAWGIPATLKSDTTALNLVSWLELPEQQSAFTAAWTADAGSLPDLHAPAPVHVNDTFWTEHLADISIRFERWVNGQKLWDN